MPTLRLTKPILILVVIAGGTFLNTLASSTVSLALPSLSADLHLPLQLSRWIMLSILLTSTVCLLWAGWLSDQWGYRSVYLMGFILFGLSSLSCGLARSFWPLLFSRIFQGVGTAMIVAVGPALLTTTFPAQQRGQALGMLGTATYVGLTFGPPLGGLILKLLNWPWIFLINVPISTIIIALGYRLLPNSPPVKSGDLDIWGSLLLVIGLPLLLITLNEASRWGLHHWLTISLFSFGIISLLLFYWHEARHPYPLLNLKLFHSRPFSGATISAFCNYIALFVGIFLMPFYLVEGRSLTPSTAGFILSAQPLMMALISSPAGWLSDKIGSRSLATGGMLLSSVALIGLGTAGQHTSPWGIAGWYGLIGFGTGLFISPNSSTLMGAAPEGEQGIAGAVLAIARSLGMTVGISLGTIIFSLAGGQTGASWKAIDFSSLRFSLWAAAGVSLVGAATSFFLNPKLTVSSSRGRK